MPNRNDPTEPATAGLEAVIEITKAAVAPVEISPTEAFLLPHGTNGRPMLVDAEELLPTPRRARGETHVFDAASLILLINAAAGTNPDGSAGHGSGVIVYVDNDVASPSVVAILNDHDGRTPGWRDLRAILEFRPTPAWLRWTRANDKFFDQAPFAEFLRDNRNDVKDPGGMAMVDIATQLQATSTVGFRSAIRLKDGTVQFTHTEDTQAQVGAGQIEVPDTFTLALQPFQGSKLYEVQAQFRYRLSGGALKLGFVLDRLDELVAAIVADAHQAIETATSATMLLGRAPEPVEPPSMIRFD